MSIQILGLRKWTPKGETEEKTYDAFFDKGWGADSVKDLFKNLDTHLEKIPDTDRWNLFYTLSNCTDQKRDFKSCSTLAFDIDGGIDKKTGHDKGTVELERWQAYAQAVARTLNCDPLRLTVVNSGNGLHFLFLTEGAPIRDRDFFKKNRHHYTAICKKINAALKANSLGGEADPSIFEHRRILRLPGTTNRKPNQPDKPTEILQGGLQRIGFDLKKLSGLPDISKTDQIPKEILARYPTTDDAAIKAGCEFLKWAKQNPNEVSEPLWYAALSIAGRMESGVDFAHELSAGHEHYSREETEQKLDQALAASGPRTCENIRGLGFEGCEKCRHNGAVISPISIVSEGHVKTAHTGFHSYIPGKGLIPNYQDLRQFFENQTHYRGYETSKEVMQFTGTHYTPCGWTAIEQFAQKHFNPPAKTNMTKEFLNLVIRTNLEFSEFWRGTERKINFANGYLDIKTGAFSPHTQKLGFRYVLPYNYDPDAKAPVFEKMLKRVTCGDSDLQRVLLEFMGYCMSNDRCWTQKALVLVGGGENGKSTFLTCLMNLAGEGNYSSATVKDLQRSEYSRQLLDGKLFNIAEETPTNALVDSSLFKTLVTGGELQVRTIYKEPYFLRNRAKCLYSCNELADVTDTTHGFYRRLLIAPFNARFSKNDLDYDPHIDKKLEGELAGIFNLALWGYKQLCTQDGFTDAKKVAETVEIYKRETDTVLDWFKENTVVNGDREKFAPLSELYTNYKIQTEGQGRRPVTRTKFTRDLRQHVGDFDDRYQVKKMPDTKALKRGLVGVVYGEGVGLG